MRISVVGPSYPFRGGIAHYTSLLCASLGKRHEVKLFSLTRQYPSLLFPGRTQMDSSNVQINVDGTEPVLDSVNPFSWVKTARRINGWQPDVVIIQWWHPFFAPAFGTVAAFCRKKSRVLFLCHNVMPHERGGPVESVTKAALKKADGFIVHSEEDLSNLKRLVPGGVAVKSPHPSYDVFNTREIDRDGARKKLGVSGRVILFFGLVRAYKGLGSLLDAMPNIAGRLNDAVLVVAGEFYEDKSRYMDQIKALGISERVVVHDRYVPNEEVSDYFAAADVVVLPYTSATQSGIVQIAYGFDRPVITTDAGGLPEAVKDGLTGTIVPVGDTGALSEAVVRFFEDDLGDRYSRNISRVRGEFSWDRMVESVESLCAEVCGC